MCALAIGFRPVNVALPGCSLSLFVAPVAATIAGVTDGGGRASALLPRVCDPAIDGLSVFTQGFFVDPTRPCLPLTHSAGLELVYGR
jgi:hypothetical protein